MGEIEDQEKFKLRLEELADEALIAIKRIKELELEFEKLMERKNAGENVKDLLKQNENELKRLKKKELKMYLESKKILKTERERREIEEEERVPSLLEVNSVTFPFNTRPRVSG